MEPPAVESESDLPGDYRHRTNREHDDLPLLNQRLHEQLLPGLHPNKVHEHPNGKHPRTSPR